jgi:predicted RNase H-like nuclease (RuvC/YqgF family)
MIFGPSLQRLQLLSTKVETAEKRADDAEASVKIVRPLCTTTKTQPTVLTCACCTLTLQYKQEVLEKEQQIASLQHKLQLSEDQNEKYEAQLKDYKTQAAESESHRTTGENLTRKVQMLEEELEQAEKDLKETHEKWVSLFVI